MRKSIAIALFILGMAGIAGAGTIYDLEVNGLYTPGDYVNVICGTVTAVTSNGCAVAEAPFQMGNSVWVYLGSGHTAQVGDIVTVYGVYEEYYDLTEINVGYHLTADPPATFTKVGVCTEMPAPIYITAADLMAAPEHYESCILWLTDGFSVTDLFSYGEWGANSWESGTPIRFDDYWFDETVLTVGTCANWAIGMWTYSYGLFELHPFVDGYPVIDCAVDSEPASMGDVKAMFR